MYRSLVKVYMSFIKLMPITWKKLMIALSTLAHTKVARLPAA